MKSAYERAMERFGSEPVKSLTDEQRAEIAAIGDKYKAKIAERELFLNDLVAKAIAEGRYHEIPELKTQLAREIASLEADCEAAKEKVRAAS
ncbi:MAG: hypothetical protein KGR69_07875 [Verrucomicrobia bacterium]|nr:hypothetical protein [Verrucomicrobiota bacterium]